MFVPPGITYHLISPLRNVKRELDFGTEFCDRGDQRCGRCDCPEGYNGARCQCQDGQEVPPNTLNTTLISPPTVASPEAHTVKRLLKGAPGEPLHMAAAIKPQSCTDCLPLRCNQALTSCQNPNSCNRESGSDAWRWTNAHVIYGSHRLTPGSTITFRVNFCEDELIRRGTNNYISFKLSKLSYREATKIGFGRPPSESREYSLPQDQAGALTRLIPKHIKSQVQSGFRYWTEEAYYWNLGQIVWGSKGKRMHAWHRWGHFNERRSDFYDADNAPDTWGSRITYDSNSDLTLKVTKKTQ